MIKSLFTVVMIVVTVYPVQAQTSNSSTAPADLPAVVNMSSDEAREHMMDQLGIKALRQ